MSNEFDELEGEEADERREIVDADVDAMVRRLIKQARETLEASSKAATNAERSETLRAVVSILEGLLPEQLSGDALLKLVDETIVKLGASTKRDMGRVLGALAKATGGNFDRVLAARLLRERLA